MANVQWFPGHMKKAERMMQDSLRLVDVVCELADARIPYASRNPDLDGIIAGRKPRLLILNRADQADPAVTALWRAYYKENGVPFLECDASSGRGVKNLPDALRALRQKQGTVRVMVVGVPNVGKSSILNRILGHKIAIVSSKPQTTRTRITGILTDGEDQLVFIDTPGLLKPRNELGEYMVKAINESVPNGDVAVLVAEATGGVRKGELSLIEKLKKSDMPAILAINKIDTLKNKKEELMEAILSYSELYNFDAVVPISAETGEGFEALLEELKKHCVAGGHFFDDDAITDQPEKVIVSEIIREKILRLCDKEIPHGTAVVIESLREREDGDIMDIEATIFCERDSHKGIIIGKKGAMLKKISTYARQDIERFFGCKVNLQTWVKVKEDWRNRRALLTNFGYDKKNFE